MRMQLSRLISVVVILFSISEINAQGTADSSKIRLDDIEVSFISSYYEQDGQHSPVTGGIGTEQLTNVAPMVVIVYPTDSAKTINFDGGIDFYSSASSDNINNPFGDVNHVSGASAKDQRAYFNLGYKVKNKKNNASKSISAGVSSEFDVQSLSLGGGLSKASKDDNFEVNLKAKYYFDNWKLIYPIELRIPGVEYLTTNKRHSLNLSLTGASVINKRMTASLTSDFVFQSGLLSTPFHRVYFENSTEAVVEQLPGTRIKIPIGVRFNYFINDYVVLRSFYRFYWDNWGMTGHTVKVELPVKINQGLRIYPFYRYHMQSGVRYFSAFGTHQPLTEFYTSDFDLSGLTSQKLGLGLTVSPLFGIGRFKGLVHSDRITMFKSIDLRYANYQRSDGLRANILTLGLNFKIDNYKKTTQ